MDDITLSSLTAESGLDAESEDFLLWALDTVIRPRFSSAKPATVTPHGRKAINVVQRSTHEVLEETKNLWKHENVVSIFAHVVTAATESFVREHWHLFVPPLLTILDDPTASFRSRGLSILSTFLTKTSSQLLGQTGIGEVLEDAVVPTLLFLPNLTPVKESLLLLNPAYDVLLQLTNVRFPDSRDGNRGLKMQSLDRIVRKGIFQGFLSCNDNPQILELLIRKLDLLIKSMGLHAVLHLRESLLHLVPILLDPFILVRPSLVSVTLDTLQTTMLNCWPRICQRYHYIEIIKGLSLCWANLAGEDIHDASEIRQQIRVCGQILRRCLPQSEDLDHDIAPMLIIDPSMREFLAA